ncbi:MAG: formamidopyrimidine-DNA glycosylase [Candidatus Parcubacteria bacterium]|nr:MAG: formamidopyrimidine-DNA glycosylase [Candidatus Parcubacteria bacterium]
MPELPEVETIKNYLRKNIIGKEIVGFQNLNKKQIKIKEKDIVGEKILDLQRRGKILILKLSNNKDVFVHLKMTGQLIYAKNKEILKSTRAVFELCELARMIDDTQMNANFIRDDWRNKNIRNHLHYLIFNDARKFGWIKLKAEEIKNLGIEPFSKEFNLKNLEKIFQKSKRPIKIVLMDQTEIAGIGNIYASESLFLAKINPQKPANKLTKEEIKRLRNSILKILKKALQYEGTSSRFYIKPDQTKGRYQEKFLVYQREGKKCFRCKSKIKRIVLGGRSTFYCQICQK